MICSPSLPQSMSCRARGVQILVVAIGRGVSNKELDGMASEPVENNVLFADSFADLTSVVAASLRTALCNSKFRNGRLILLRTYTRTQKFFIKYQNSQYVAKELQDYMFMHEPDDKHST